MLPGFLTILLVRVGLGERLEAAKSEDYRASFGFFFLFPWWLGFSVYLGHLFLEHAGGLAIWASVVVSALVFLLAQALWIVFVPASVSLILGVTTWLTILWIAWHGGFPGLATSRSNPYQALVLTASSLVFGL